MSQDFTPRNYSLVFSRAQLEIGPIILPFVSLPTKSSVVASPCGWAERLHRGRRRRARSTRRQRARSTTTTCAGRPVGVQGNHARVLGRAEEARQARHGGHGASLCERRGRWRAGASSAATRASASSTAHRVGVCDSEATRAPRPRQPLQALQRLGQGPATACAGGHGID